MAKTNKTFSYNLASRFPSLTITDNSALNTLANNKKAKLAFLFGSNASNINSCINLMKTQFMNDYFSSPFDNFDTFREDSGIYNDSSKYAFDSSNFDNQTIQLKSSVPYMAIVLFLANTEDITKFAIERTGFDSLSFVSLEDSGDNVGKMYIIKNGSAQYFSMNTNASTASFVMSYQAETAKHITFTKNLTNCTITPDVDSIDLPTTTILRITANNGYRFNDVPTITISDIVHNFIENAGVYEYDLSGLSDTTDIQAVINAVAVEIPQIKTATITKNLVNCTMSPDVETYTEYSDLTLIFTCNENYSFSGVPYIDTNIYAGSTEQINAIKINDNEYSLTMPKTAFIDIQSINYYIDVHATAIFNTETVNKYGLICLYKPTKQNMIDLSKERFLRVGETDSYEDLGKYITSLKRIYLDVDSIGTNKIILGNHTTNINADMISDDDVIIDLGNATITGEYNNEMDAKHAEIQVILPFISIVSLDAEKVMNKTINIKYKCNLITGVCIAYIYLVENDSLILLSTFNGVMGFDVPYILKPDSETIVNNSNVDASNIFNVPPKINIYENLKAETDNNIYDTFYIDTISNIKNGFVAVRKILSTNNTKIMLDDENVMIENILKNGFII